jgi:Rrf2 family protein
MVDISTILPRLNHAEAAVPARNAARTIWRRRGGGRDARDGPMRYAGLGRRVRTISKRTQYGLRAMLALSRVQPGKPMLIATLAKQEAIPLKFLELILLKLKGHGLLESKSGKGGGYRLSRPPAEITVGTVIRMLEGPLAPLPCASETAYKPCDDCHDVEGCGTRIVMREVRDAIAGVLDKTTLADVVERVDLVHSGKDSADALMYYI